VREEAFSSRHNEVAIASACNFSHWEAARKPPVALLPDEYDATMDWTICALPAEGMNLEAYRCGIAEGVNIGRQD
jgi:hypothetical protein